MASLLRAWRRRLFPAEALRRRDRDLSALYDACNDGSLVVVSAVAARLEADDVRSDSRIMRAACARGDTAILRELFALGLTMDDLRADGLVPFHVACLARRVDALLFLVQLGLTAADVRKDNGFAIRIACGLEAIRLDPQPAWLAEPPLVLHRGGASWHFVGCLQALYDAGLVAADLAGALTPTCRNGTADQVRWLVGLPGFDAAMVRADDHAAMRACMRLSPYCAAWGYGPSTCGGSRTPLAAVNASASSSPGL